MTIPAREARRRRLTTLHFTARRRRWSSVGRSRGDCCAAGRPRFSSRRYSMTACCCRLTHPENSGKKKKGAAEATGPYRKRARGAAPVQGFEYRGVDWAEFP